LFHRNKDYLVQGGKVVIVDEFTGRLMPGRRWSDGLHQAVEAKEAVRVEPENVTYATITLQNYFRMYKKLAGMTGTADTEAEEFHQIYKLSVTVIPTNKPIIRKDFPDLVYKNEAGKFRAVAEDIEDCYKRGQPVLVGTVSVEKSEVVANILKQKGLPFNVLNAKQHQREASIVAQAGRRSAITIATNMAGRGTDILLGGNPEAMAKDALQEERDKLALEASQATADQPDKDGEPFRGHSEPQFDEEARLKELIEQFKQQCEAERQEVLAAGGLKIVGTERHESRRIDNQLRGRAGRQGDPGSSRFYLSLQDDLLRIFGLDRMTGLMERLGLEEDVPIESPMVTRSIENAQKKVEGRNFDQRKNVLEYDDVMNQQRKTIYSLRRQILEGRYHPEPTEEQEKEGFVPEPVTESGDWTQDTIRPDVQKTLEKMIAELKGKVSERDAALARGEQVNDTRPGWRVLRAEIWRQFGTWLDIEKRYDSPDLLEWAATEVAASQIQQRERLYDLSHTEMANVIDHVLDPEIGEDEWDWNQLDEALAEAFDIPYELSHGTPDEAATQAWPEIEEKLGEREKELTRPWLLYFLRHFYLEEIDQQWIEHLKTMDALREGIGLQGYGQKDPKKEYKKAGFTLFTEMMERIQENVIKKLFHVQIKREEEAIPALQQEKQRQMVERGVADKNDDEAAEGNGDNEKVTRRGKARVAGEGPTTAPIKRDRPKVGRNDPCPCGSGKKYKKCHGKDEEAAASE
ncbi:MAG TPA: SEC-C metal-binding domain-containing protein, partial [Kofleriaceae bacterium]